MNQDLGWLRAGIHFERCGQFPSTVTAVEIAKIKEARELFSLDCIRAAFAMLMNDFDLFSKAAKVNRNGYGEGFVYLAACDTGHHKIGRSKSPANRIKHFDTQMPVSVAVVHTIRCDNAPWAEAELHRIYADRRVKGEWFELDDRDLDEITRISSFESGFFFGRVERLASYGAVA